MPQARGEAPLQEQCWIERQARLEEAAQGPQHDPGQDLADKEAFEISIIQAYMPQPLRPEELEQLINAAISETGAVSVKDMGKVMGRLKSQVQGRADMGAVSTEVKSRLASAG